MGGRVCYPTETEQDSEGSGAVVDLNIDGARRALRIFEGIVSDIERQSSELVVNSTVSAQAATEMIGQVKDLEDKIESRRKEIIDVPDKFVRKTNAFVKPMMDRLKAIEGKGGIINRKLADYSMRVELQRREIERKQNEARIELQKQVDAEAKAKGVESVVIAPVAMPTKKEPVRSDSAVSSAVMVWKHEVTDAAAVPRAYLMVDDAAIKAAVKAGIRIIPGVRIFEDAEMRVRRVG
jgi:hypothetical protein